MSSKISELPIAGLLSGVESVPLVQEGETKQATINDIGFFLKDTVADSLVLFYLDGAEDHKHAAVMNRVDSIRLIRGDVGNIQVTTTTDGSPAHSHVLSVSFDYELHEFYVTGISNNTIDNHTVHILQGKIGPAGADGAPGATGPKGDDGANGVYRFAGLDVGYTEYQVMALDPNNTAPFWYTLVHDRIIAIPE